MADHVRVQMAALSRIDLDGWRAGGADALRVIGGLLVAFDHGDRKPVLERLDRRTSRLVLPEPGLETRLRANSRLAANARRLSRA